VFIFADFADLGPQRASVEAAQDKMVNMLRRFLMAAYPREVALAVLGNLLSAVADLRELTEIKRRRSLAAPVTQPGSEAAAAAAASSASASPAPSQD